MPETAREPWEIVARPKGSNQDGKNDSGIIVELRNRSGTVEEVDRILYVRANSTNPDVDFKTQFAKTIGTAREAVTGLNKLFTNAGTGS